MSLPMRIYADFNNADVHGRIRLNCNGTLADLNKSQLELREGLSVRLYMEDIEAEGRVVYSIEESLWVAEINWNAIEASRGSDDSAQ